MNPETFQVGKIYSMSWNLNDSKIHFFLVLKQSSKLVFDILRDDELLQNCYLSDKCFEKAKLVYG